MEIRLSTSDGVPVYRQIANQVKRMVAMGRLRPGDELPAIRVLAEQLVINPNTVVHAYEELEKEGVVAGRHGSGTYVTESAPRRAPSEAMRGLESQVDALLTEAVHLDMDLDEVLQLILGRYKHLKQAKKS
jgi:GntR family transcriptional regulator